MQISQIFPKLQLKLCNFHTRNQFDRNYFFNAAICSGILFQYLAETRLFMILLIFYFNCKVTSRPIWSVSVSCPRLSRWPRIIAYDMCSTMILQHFVDKYNLLYVYPVNGSQHVRSGGQMGGTVHDLVLFSLCLMQYVTASVICDVWSVCDDARGGR